MVDNRSAGVLGIGGGLNFKSGDISGTAAKTSDDKASQGTEYFAMEDPMGEQSRQEPFVDRSSQLKATLNSLAMMNVVNIIKATMPQKTSEKDKKKDKSQSKTDYLFEEVDDESEIDYLE